MSENSYKSFLRNYYLASFFYDFVFAYAIYNVLFSRRGLSVFQISLLLSWWALTAFLLQIPSGALADYWSRKGLLVLAPMSKAICFLIWFLGDANFYLYGLGFLFWSLGSSLVSGTSEALLYDHLVFFERKNEYERVLGRKRFYYFIALALSMMTGGFIAYYDLNSALIFSVIPLMFSAGFALMIIEIPKAELSDRMRFFEHMRLACREVQTNKLLFFFLIYYVGLTFFEVIEEFDQLYYDLAGLPIYAFGIVMSLWAVLGAAGSFHAHRFRERTWVFAICPFASGGLLVLVGLFPSIPMIALLLLSYFIASPLRVLIDSRVQHSIKSVSRATVTSVSFSLIYLAGIVLTPLFGLISRMWNLQAIYLCTGVFLLIFSGWVLSKRRMFIATRI